MKNGTTIPLGVNATCAERITGVSILGRDMVIGYCAINALRSKIGMTETLLVCFGTPHSSGVVPSAERYEHKIGETRKQVYYGATPAIRVYAQELAPSAGREKIPRNL